MTALDYNKHSVCVCVLKHRYALITKSHIILISKDMKPNCPTSFDTHNIAKHRKEQGPVSQGQPSGRHTSAITFCRLA